MDAIVPLEEGWTSVARRGGAPLDAYVARPGRGSAPGVLVLCDAFGVNASVRRLCADLAAEGYLAVAPDLLGQRTELGFGEESRAASLAAQLDSETALRDVADGLEALRAMPGRVGKLGVVAFGAGGAPALTLAARQMVDCAVVYAGADLEAQLRRASPTVPTALHVAGAARLAAEQSAAIRSTIGADGQASIFVYPSATHGFAYRGHPRYDAPHAAMAYSRTIAALKHVMGPHYNLEELWEAHLACEFVAQDATATMRTMVSEPYVNHVPTLTGGVGHDMLKRFYAHHFVKQVPRDRKTIPISRTVGAGRIVDEKIFCFTHDCEIDWLLPGVPPTGKYVEIPLVGIVTFRGDKLVNEHIYWDQASVLVQIGLLDPKNLPVAGAEQAKKLLDPQRPSNALMAAWRRSEGKPV
jgi:carboxymethylenebutenolidase